MATKGSSWVLRVVVATLLVVASQAAAVTIYNPAKLVVHIGSSYGAVANILNDDDKKNRASVGLVMDQLINGEAMMTMELTQAEQDLQFSIGEGAVTTVSVQGGDEIILFPDPEIESITWLKVFTVVPAGEPQPPTMRAEPGTEPVPPIESPPSPL